MRQAKADYIKPSLYSKLYSSMTYENVLVMRTSLETGMRVGDVVALTPQQLNKRTITYTAAKTGKRDRKVISQELANRLRRIAGRRWIFEGRNPSKHRTRQAVWADVRKACKEAGISEHASPHSARKTYAVRIFQADGLKAVQDELQHDSIETSMLYAFSNLLSAGTPSEPSAGSVEVLAELVADKGIERLKKYYERK